MPKNTFFLLLIFACLPWSTASAQTSYGSYYQKNIKKPSQQIRGGQSVNDYLFDKYYKGNRGVSPYANLNRGMSGTGYQAQVRPEQQRRAQFQSGLKTYVTDKKQSGQIGHTNYGFAKQLQRGVPSAGDIPKVRKPTPYYNQWYGK